MIVGKILNARAVLMRALRDHPLSVDKTLFRSHIRDLQDAAVCAAEASSPDELRGIEGNGAQSYFSSLTASSCRTRNTSISMEETKDRPWTA